MQCPGVMVSRVRPVSVSYNDGIVTPKLTARTDPTKWAVVSI